ncbi:hypothetical protein, partial [Treponema sp. R80B11-R83G3]
YLINRSKRMFYRKILKVFLFVFAVFFCSRCKIVPLNNEAFIPEDFSFPVSGNILEKNNIISVLEVSLKSNKTVPNAGILLEGQIKKPILQNKPTEMFMPMVNLKNQGDYINVRVLPKYKQSYFWSGTISIGNYSTNANVTFDAYGTKNGSGKQFILTKAVIGQTNLQFDDPFEISDHGEDFPFLVGYSNTIYGRYRIYAIFGNLNENIIMELKNSVALLVCFLHSTKVLKDINNDWDLPLFYRYVYPYGK